MSPSHASTPRIAILGASGYTGQELRKLLARHPGLQLDLAMTARADHAPPPPDTSFDPAVAPLDLDKLRYVDGVFCCTPHGAAAPLVQAALEAGCKVVDLSADFRLRDPKVYERVYGQPHPAPALLEEAVYGLTEHTRSAVAKARLIANPGCYPTCVLLPLLPLLQNELIELEAGVVADCKSGVSGAGKTPKDRTIFGAVHDNFLAYGVGDHRHAPEIWQEAGTENITFVPHLLPTFRGMFATIYVTPKPGVDAAKIGDCIDSTYAREPFVRFYGRGLPEIDRVQHTNYCDIAVRPVPGGGAKGRVVILSTIDNLGKGAASQALQNMNRMLGQPEEAGLE